MTLKNLISATAFKQANGKMSDATFYRRKKSDPKFPRIYWIGNRQFLDADEAAAYQASLCASKGDNQ